MNPAGLEPLELRLLLADGPIISEFMASVRSSSSERILDMSLPARG